MILGLPESSLVKLKEKREIKKKIAHSNSEILIKQKTSNASHTVGAVDSGDAAAVLVKAT